MTGNQKKQLPSKGDNMLLCNPSTGCTAPFIECKTRHNMEDNFYYLLQFPFFKLSWDMPLHLYIYCVLLSPNIVNMWFFFLPLTCSSTYLKNRLDPLDTFWGCYLVKEFRFAGQKSIAVRSNKTKLQANLEKKKKAQRTNLTLLKWKI